MGHRLFSTKVLVGAIACVASLARADGYIRAASDPNPIMRPVAARAPASAPATQKNRKTKNPAPSIAKQLPPKKLPPKAEPEAVSPLDLPAKEPPPSEIAEFLRIVDGKRKKCLKRADSGKPPVGVCAEIKVLYQLEVLGKAYLATHEKADKLNRQLEFARTEDYQLRSELKAIRSPASYEEYRGCYKKDFLKELLMSYGVNENGSIVFSKIPVGAGNCWSNSKKKQEATITICEYPLAIFMKTKGGIGGDTVNREKQYLFSLNGCDLVATQIHDSGSNGEKETYLTYDNCRTQWNKRTADAAMSPTQVRLMEDTIGACFREHLLPPRNQEGGRSNPAIAGPPGGMQPPSAPASAPGAPPRIPANNGP